VYGSVTILRQQLVTKPGGQPVSEPTPPGDILVLVLTRDSCTVYKTMIVMCGAFFFDRRDVVFVVSGSDQPIC